MSWTDEEIDNLFRDGAEAQSFKYDDAYFAEIEGALPVNGKGKDFLWMGTALVFIAILTTGYFVNNANDASFNNTNDQLANVELNTTNENTNTSNETTVANGDLNETNNNAEATDLNNQTSISESSNSNANSATGINKNAGNSSLTNSQKSGNTNTQRQVGDNSMYSIATRNVGASRTNDQSNDQLGSAGDTDTQTGAQEGSSSQNLEDTRSDQKQFTLQSAPITASLDLNGANQLDQDLNQSLAPSMMPLGLGPVRPKAAFYFELNAGVSQSLITPSDLVSKSVGGGIGVETYLGDFNLNTGLNFKTSYHDDLYLTRTGKVYGFGANEGKNEYDVKKIYSIEMPITLGYNFGRHNLNLGVRPSLVVSTGTQFYAFENGQSLNGRYYNGFVVEEVENESVAEEIDVVKRFGLKPTIGYSYRINNWTIGANVGVQLMHSVNEELFDLNNSQLPIDGQIYLRRTIRLRR